MIKKLFLISFLFSSLLFSGCGDGGDNITDSEGQLTGTYIGSGKMSPTAGGEAISFDFNLTLNLQHSGNIVTGSYSFARPGRSLSGTVSGTAASGLTELHLDNIIQISGSYHDGIISGSIFENWGGGNGLTGTVNLTKTG